MGIEDTMGLLGSHRTLAQGPAGRGKKPAKKLADPYYQVKTKGEVEAIRDKGGIAKTAKNMGSLGVQFREDEEATEQAGGVTEAQKRVNKLTTIRQEDKTKRWNDAALVKEKFWNRYKKAKKNFTRSKGLDPKSNRGLGNVSNVQYAGPGSAPRGVLTAPSYGLFK